MPQQPLVSVVIPAYRGGPMLRRAVQSMIDQTFRQLEIIVVSDGSDDPMEDLQNADPRVRVARMEHRGVSATRNTGLLEASSDFVAFMDEDDIALPRRIGLQYEALCDHPYAAICHSQVQVIDEDESPVGPPQGGERTYLDLLRASFVYMTSLMVRRQPALIAGGFDTLMTVGEDIDFVLRLAKDYDLVYVPEVLTLYRRHPANTKTSPLISQRVIDPILRAHQRWALEHGWTEAAEAAARGARSSRRINALGASHDAVEAWKAGRLVEAGRQLGISLRIHPQVAPEDFVRGAIKRVHPEH
jgi:glycosyltransferase involved in cell wall biosynthesis